MAQLRAIHANVSAADLFSASRRAEARLLTIFVGNRANLISFGSREDFHWSSCDLVTVIVVVHRKCRIDRHRYTLTALA